MKKDVILCAILLIISYSHLFCNEITSSPQESEPITNNEMVQSTWLPDFKDVNFNVKKHLC